ncbi:Protein of uncharacterised function (DUF1120) [Serratia entomophila]|uniref:DUF1120 domain-containing protein n=1 Tax=Serratia entomophila TaxID=42906 RepID=UPI001F33284D|nr:DUF1120 domain-containing protein [Serratia entomophila]UIW17417.1 DUF1120 domain-containing protein [Serratia entomophila]CAI0994442.1 Protein of uncharacterised function (DUF1120) [Serratia entomophila]CAI1156476.1 Protein of uncharacterised function (DUF1120) [Serratia entomophila]CAI1159546.1 Protein of uncharacterised function (DUF1120) [Serratia entomophila]CAI1162999.1 Protein of uncharacterised function (DUF1120) [Serratia entomophila]
MKKRLLQTGVLGLWVFFSGQLIAAPSAELKVSGKIKHSGCAVIASNNGVYDYGSVPGNAADEQRLPTLKQAWQVRCESEAYLAIIPTDNRAASRSAQDPRRFGLSNTADGRPVGYFLLGLTHATVNGAPAALRSRAAASAQPGSDVALISGERSDWLLADATRAAGRTYTMEISVTPVLAANIPVTDKVELDGSVTLNFVFGL